MAVALPRFNLRDPGPIGRFTAGAKDTRYGLPLDVAGYVRLVEYFRHQVPADSLIAPYCYRPLVPFVASRVPADPLTSINIVNLACLLLTVILLDRLLALVGTTSARRTGGCLLFIVSFPTFYYGAIGFVDPAGILFLTLGLLFTLKRNFRGQLAAMVGVLAKETVGLVACLDLIRLWVFREWTALRALRAVTLGAAGVALLVGFRMLAPFPEPEAAWTPDLPRLAENLSRSRAWLSLGLTVGLPGVLAGARLWRDRGREEGRALRRFFAGGCALAVAVYLYSLVSAYADGRIIWVLYPFAIPLAVADFSSRGPAPCASRF